MKPNYSLDAQIVGVNLHQPHDQSVEHAKVVAFLVKMISRYLTEQVNYDHMNAPIPKTQLPLRHRGKDYDIVFLYADKLVFVEVDTEKLEKVDLAKGG